MSTNKTTGLPNDHVPEADRNPAQHHESAAATRDRAYHIAREAGMSRSDAKEAAGKATESARRARGA